MIIGLLHLLKIPRSIFKTTLIYNHRKMHGIYILHKNIFLIILEKVANSWDKMKTSICIQVIFGLDFPKPKRQFKRKIAPELYTPGK